MTGTSSSTVAVNLRVDQLAMEPLERFRLSLSPQPGFGPDPATEIFIDELTIEIIDNDSEQEWSVSLHSSMPLSLPPFFLSLSCLPYFILCFPLSPPYILFCFPFFASSSSHSSTFFLQILPFLTLTPSFLPPLLHMCTRNSSAFFCIYLLFPSSVYVLFLPSVLIPTSYHSFLLPSYSSSHSQMCQFGLTRKTMVIQRPLVESISKCNEQL